MRAKRLWILPLTAAAFSWAAGSDPAELKKAISDLRQGEETVVVPRALALTDLDEETSTRGHAVTSRGRLQNLAGNRVLVLTDKEKGATEQVLVILTDPTDTSQQATYRVGDIITATGILTYYDENEIRRVLNGDPGGVDLGAFQGVPTILATRIQSMPPPEPETGEAGEPVEPGRAQAARPAPEPENAARPLATPEPENAARPLATPQARTSPQTPATPQATRPVIVTPATPRSEPQYLATPEAMLDDPAFFLEREVTFDATFDAAPGDRAATLQLVEDQEDPNLLGIMVEPVSVPDDGARVRVTGRLTNLSFGEIEQTEGVILDQIPLEREANEPVLLISDLVVLAPSGVFSE